MRTRIWTRLALVWLVGFCIPGPSSAGQTNGAEGPSPRLSPEQFIAAFELTPKGDFRFTWPPDSMRPAQYQTVTLVVERMPHAWDPKHRGERPTRLRARDHLRINGQPATALHKGAGLHKVESAESTERFLVRLDQGRLRVALSIPPGLKLDPSHNDARIRLYRHTGAN